MLPVCWCKTSAKSHENTRTLLLQHVSPRTFAQAELLWRRNGCIALHHLRTIHDHSEDNCKIDNPLCESLLQIKETSFPLLSLTQFALLWPRRCRTFRGGNLERWPLDFHEMIKKIKGLGPHMIILDHLLQRRPATSSAESGGVLG